MPSFSITSGVREKAQKVVIYGVEGIGKSTLAAAFPDPLFIDTEHSTDAMDVKRLEAPTSWTMLLQEVAFVRDNAAGLCSTLAIDTLDWAERQCIAQVCAAHQWKGIEDAGYGKGYVAVYEEFGKLLNLLTEVAERGVNVVCTAHCAVTKFERPEESNSYDRWALKLIRNKNANVADMVKEWADAVLFANFKTMAVKADSKSKAKAAGQARTMYANHHACWDAKNRWGLPDELPMDYAGIAPFIPDMMASKGRPGFTEQDVMDGICMPDELDAPPAAAAEGPSHVVVAPPYSGPAKDYKAMDAVAKAISKGPLSEEASAAVAALDAVAPEPEPAYLAPLRDLMAKDGITEDELRDAVHEQGHKTRETPLANYGPDYVTGFLVANWEQISKKILDRRVPFDV